MLPPIYSYSELSHSLTERNRYVGPEANADDVKHRKFSPLTKRQTKAAGRLFKRETPHTRLIVGNFKWIGTQPPAA